MEDVIPESESLLIPVNLRHTNGGANTEGHGAVDGGEGTAKGSIRSEQGEDKEVDAEKKNMNGGSEEEEEKGGGGIITHLISIVSPRSGPKGGDAGKRKGEFEVDDVGNGGFSAKSEREGGGENGNGGVFSNLISNFFNPSNGGGGGGGEVDEVNKEDEKVMKDIGNKRMKTAEEAEEGGGGGGIIDNIVSHLPISLPDCAPPSNPPPSFAFSHNRDIDFEGRFSRETAKLKPPHRFVQWVIVNNKLQEDYQNFMSNLHKLADQFVMRSNQPGKNNQFLEFALQTKEGTLHTNAHLI